MPSPESIERFYSTLAPRYDEERFGTAYGRYLHAQERRILTRWLAGIEGPVLDLPCGTGRFLDLATHGVDLSPAMAALAAAKHPGRTVEVAPADQLPFPAGSFGAVFCLHLLMHLDGPSAARIFEACWRILRPGGRLIFDVPSLSRRRLTGFRPEGWHGAHAPGTAGLKALLVHPWRPLQRRGVLFFPIHRVPAIWHAPLRHVDDLLGQTPLHAFASYHLHLLEKPLVPPA